MPYPSWHPTEPNEPAPDLRALFAANLQPWTPPYGEEEFEDAEATLNDEQRLRLSAALPFAASPRRHRRAVFETVDFPVPVASPANQALPDSDTALSSDEANPFLEWLLAYGQASDDVAPAAQTLLQTYGRFDRVTDQPPELLSRAAHLNSATATLLSLIPPLLRRVLRESWDEHPLLADMEQYGPYCAALLFGCPVERLILLCLDGRDRLIRVVLHQQGTLDKVMLHPREVLATALRYNAKRVILSHNHPGASCNPSQNDLQVTHLVAQTLNLHHIPLVDHIIVTERQWYSFAKNNTMPRL